VNYPVNYMPEVEIERHKKFTLNESVVHLVSLKNHFIVGQFTLNTWEVLFATRGNSFRFIVGRSLYLSGKV
jgi:hypothetical protein